MNELLGAKQRIDRLLRQAETLLRRPPNQERQARKGALDDLKELMAATKDLRTARGNLSADRVAKLYGISVSQLSSWLGRSRQALDKTPDADSLQRLLSYFEQVARLKAVVSEGEFRKWLRMPNPSLGGSRPLKLMATSERQLVADLVEDMLTGNPA